MCQKARCGVFGCGGVVDVDNGTRCDDDNPATVGDECTHGVCLGIPNRCAGVRCAPRNECHEWDECMADTGLCNNATKPDGAGCEDGNILTKGDSCVGGFCQGLMTCGTEKCLTPVQPCLQVSCVRGKCALTPREECSPCSDSDPDTAGDMCRGGSCIGAYAGVPRVPIAGSLYVDPGTRTTFTPLELPAELTVEIKVKFDSFSRLDTDLSCGHKGSETALILLPLDSPPELVESCFGRVVSDKVLLVGFKSTVGLESGTRIGVAQGVLESGGECFTEVHINVESHAVFNPALSSTIGLAAPGATLMQVKLASCQVQGGGDATEQVDPFMNPPKLTIGPRKKGL
eukprot:Hpha_TRINITY_DN16303_c2_g5::TRINITY_DN16303_c2_g5_i2::g.61830::m.61830